MGEISGDRVTKSQLSPRASTIAARSVSMIQGLESHIGLFLFRRIVLFDTIPRHPPAKVRSGTDMSGGAVVIPTLSGQGMVQ